MSDETGAKMTNEEAELEINMEATYQRLQKKAFKGIDKKWIRFGSSPFNWCPKCDIPLEIIDAVWKNDLLANVYKCPKCGHIEEVEI